MLFYIQDKNVTQLVFCHFVTKYAKKENTKNYAKKENTKNI